MMLRRPAIGFFGRLYVCSCGAGLMFTLCLTLFPTVGYAQSVEWAQSAGGASVDRGRAIAVAAAGNSYVTGFFQGTATFGPFALTSAGDCDIFVAKYDGGGNVLWARSAGGTLADYPEGIAVDAAGSSYVTGHFRGTATFGPFALTSAGDSIADVFVAKYDDSGNVVWARSAGATRHGNGSGVAVDAAGNSYVTGSYAGLATFGSTTLTSVGVTDVFVVQYDAGGNALWARSSEGGGEPASVDLAWASGLALDATGNSYVTGSFEGTETFGAFTLTGTSAGIADIFVAKYDDSGNVLWARSAGGTSAEYPEGIAVDAAGNSYVTGAYSDTATFGSFTLTAAGFQDVFVAKYDGGGNVLWARSAGGDSGYDQGFSIAVDPTGINFITGTYYGTAIFGPFTLTSAGFADVFVAKCDDDGNVLWVDSAGGTSVDLGLGIAVDPAGNSYVTGSYRRTATFGPFALTSAGEADVFVAKYGPGACCLSGGSCVELGQSDCDLAGGTYLGGVCEGDVDGDGVDGVCGDPCPNDANDDTDGDGVCDSDDPCPNDNPDDTDGDGVCDSDDPCPFDNPDDTDGDGVCNSDDPCPDDNPDDTDGDGVCDSDDVCPGADDNVESDGDGVPDCLDLCPGVDDAVYAPQCADAIPTVSVWGLVVLALVLLTMAKLTWSVTTSAPPR